MTTAPSKLESGFPATDNIRVTRLVKRSYVFEDKEKVRTFFTHLTGLSKNLNYTNENSPD